MKTSPLTTLPRWTATLGCTIVLSACRLEDDPCHRFGDDACAGDEIGDGGGGTVASGGGVAVGGHVSGGGRHAGGRASGGEGASGGTTSGGAAHSCGGTEDGSGGAEALGGEPDGAGGHAAGGESATGGMVSGGDSSGGAVNGGSSTGGVASGGAVSGGSSSGGVASDGGSNDGTGGASAAPRTCPPGQIVGASGTSCEFCLPGTFSDAFDATSCTPCPDGKTSALGAERCGPVANCEWAGASVSGSPQIRSLTFPGELSAAVAVDSANHLVFATRTSGASAGKVYSVIRVRRFDYCGAVMSTWDVPIPGKNPPPPGSRIPEPSVGRVYAPMLIDAADNLYFAGEGDVRGITNPYAPYVMRVRSDGTPEWVMQFPLNSATPQLIDFDRSGSVQAAGNGAPTERLLVSSDGLTLVRGPWPHGVYSPRDWAGNEYVWDQALPSGPTITVWAPDGTVRSKAVAFSAPAGPLLDPQTGVVARAWYASERNDSYAVFIDTGPTFASTPDDDHIGTIWSNPSTRVRRPKFGPAGIWLTIDSTAVQIAVGGAELQSVAFPAFEQGYGVKDIAVDELGSAFITGDQRPYGGNDQAVLLRVAAAMSR